MRSTAARLALVAGIAFVLTSSGAAAAVAAVEGDCTVTLNGVDIDRIDSLSSPLELSATDTLVFAGTAAEPTDSATVHLIIGPVQVDSGSTTYRPGSLEFSATIDLDEVSPYGVGLFAVRGTTDGCVGQGWLRISGRSPFATLTGLTAAGLTLGGLTGLLGAVASRRRWSRFAAAGGGVFTGVGAAVLGQEFGRLQLSYPTLTLSAIGAAGVGFVLGGLLSPDRSRRDGATGRPHDAEEDRHAVDEQRPARAAAARATTATTSPWVRSEPVPSPPPPETPVTGPYWCYVLAEVEVFDLTDHTRTVARLRPGSWYLCKREVGAWAHVSTGDGHEGWVGAGSLHRQG